MTRWIFLLLLTALPSCADITRDRMEMIHPEPGRPSPLRRSVDAPSPEPKEPLEWDLSSVMLRVDECPGLQALREDILKESGIIIQSSFMPNPVLGLETEMMPVDDMGFGNARNKVRISQRIETAGKADARVSLAAARKDEAEALYFHRRAETMRDAARLFYKALYAGKEAETARRLAGLKREILAQAINLSKGGRMAEKEFIAYQVAEQKALAEEKTFVARERQALRALEGLLGLAAGSVRNCGDEPLERRLPELDEARRRMLSRNTELMLLDRKLAVARAEVEAAESLVYPDVTLSLTYTRGAEMTRDRDDFVGASLQVPLPLVDRNQGGRMSAESSLRSAESALEAAAISNMDAVTGLLEERAILEEQRALYEGKIVPMLRKNAELMKKRVDVGRDSLLTRLDAEVELQEGILSALVVRERLAGVLTDIQFVLGGTGE